MNDYSSSELDKKDTIWRYTSLAKLLNMVKSESNMDLVAYRSDKFEDNYEGTLFGDAEARLKSQLRRDGARKHKFGHYTDDLKFPNGPSKKNREYYRQEADEKFATRKEMMQQMREVTFLNCWKISNYEDSTMWDAYTSKSDGVAIKTSVENLLESIDSTDGDLYAGDVRYSSSGYTGYNEPSMYTEPIRPFFYKTESFKMESEYRLVVTDYHDEEFDIERGTDAMPSIDDSKKREISVDTSKLVDEIRVHPKSGDYLTSVVNGALKRKGANLSVDESSLKSNFLRND